MDLYDLLMILVLGANLLLGVWKGMAWQVASIASLTLSYFMALRYSTTLAPMLGVGAPLNRFVAMLALYIGSSLFVWLCARAVSGFIDRVRLQGFDHQTEAERLARRRGAVVRQHHFFRCLAHASDAIKCYNPTPAITSPCC